MEFMNWFQNVKKALLNRIKSVEVLDIKPGDILIVKFNGVPSPEEIMRASNGMKHLFPNRILFYDERIQTIKVMREREIPRPVQS